MEEAMIPIGLNYSELPYWERTYADILCRPRVELVSKPWPNSSPSSGGYYPSAFELSSRTGVTRWFADILSAPEAGFCSITTAEVPTALSEIRDGLSLKTAHLSTVLLVTRQTIYNWLDGKAVDLSNRRRIAAVRWFAHHWLELHGKPMGPIVAEEFDGESILSLLSGDVLDERRILRKFSVINDLLSVAQANRQLSAREIAEMHGLRSLTATEHRKNTFTAGLRYGRRA